MFNIYGAEVSGNYEKKIIGRLSFDQDELLYMNQEAKQQRGVSSEKVVRFFASLIFGFIYVILTS